MTGHFASGRSSLTRRWLIIMGFFLILFGHAHMCPVSATEQRGGVTYYGNEDLKTYKRGESTSHHSSSGAGSVSSGAMMGRTLAAYCESGHATPLGYFEGRDVYLFSKVLRDNTKAFAMAGLLYEEGENLAYISFRCLCNESKYLAVEKITSDRDSGVEKLNEKLANLKGNIKHRAMDVGSSPTFRAACDKACTMH